MLSLSRFSDSRTSARTLSMLSLSRFSDSRMLVAISACAFWASALSSFLASSILRFVWSSLASNFHQKASSVITTPKTTLTLTTTV